MSNESPEIIAHAMRLHIHKTWGTKRGLSIEDLKDMTPGQVLVTLQNENRGRGLKWFLREHDDEWLDRMAAEWLIITGSLDNVTMEKVAT